MQTVLLLFLASHALGFDPVVCQNSFLEVKNQCLSVSCSDLLTTGPGGKLVVRNADECKTECGKLALMTVENDEACLKPTAPKASANSSNQSEAQAKAKQEAIKGEEGLKAQQARAIEAKEFGQQVQDNRLKSNREIVNRWDQELSTGKSQHFPADRTKWKNDQRLVKDAERAKAKKEIFPAEKADQAYLPPIRGNLKQFSRAQDLESKSTKDISLLAIAITKLMRMKSSGKKNIDALDTEIKTASRATSPNAVVPKSQDNLPSSLAGHGETTPGRESKEEISASKPDKVDSELAQDSEAKAIFKRSSLKAQLRELLRKKIAGSGPGEIPEEFLGELGLPLEASFSDLTPEEKENYLSKIEEEVFQLAGAETDAEIRRLQSELENELGNESDRSEGVLPSESQNLFARVKAAHDACIAKKCVLKLKEIVVAGRI